MVKLACDTYSRFMTRCFTLAGAAIAVLAFALPLSLHPASGSAQSLVSQGGSFLAVRLIPGRAEPDGSRLAGLAIELEPGWKTYWRSPGAAGIPPRFDWSKSRNLGAAEVLWPRPHLFESFGLTTLGYADQVVFPLRLRPERPDEPITVDLSLALGVCRDICVLEEARVEAEIAPGAAESGAELIAAAEAAVPRPGTELGMTAATCEISGAGDKRRFDARIEFDRPLEAPVVLLEGPETAWFTGVETTPEAGGSQLRVAAEISLLDAASWVSRSDVRMTVLAGDLAADVQGCAAPAS